MSLGTEGSATSKLYDRSFELTARQFAAFSDHAQDMTEPLTKIGEDLHTQVAAAFATQGDTGTSGRWTQLSTPYGMYKAQHNPGAPLLVGLRHVPKGTRQHPDMAGSWPVSGRMMRQLLVPVTDSATWHITPKRMLYAPLSDIAGYHETGTDKMPPRPPVDPTATFLHSVDRTFLTWIGKLVDESGL